MLCREYFINQSQEFIFFPLVLEFLYLDKIVPNKEIIFILSIMNFEQTINCALFGPKQDDIMIFGELDYHLKLNSTSLSIVK